ncbi:ribonuclease H-like domain-containing protein [Tanacetum coccineum]
MSCTVLTPHSSNNAPVAFNIGQPTSVRTIMAYAFAPPGYFSAGHYSTLVHGNGFQPIVGPTATTGQATNLPHAFSTETLRDLNNGAWNMDTSVSSHLNSSVTSLNTVFNTSVKKNTQQLDSMSCTVLTPHSSNNAPVAFNMGQPTSFSPTNGLMLAAPPGFSQPAHHSTAGPLTLGPSVASYLTQQQVYVNSFQPAQQLDTQVHGNGFQPVVGPTATTGQATNLPHAFSTETLRDLNNGAWNMDTSVSSHLNSSVTSLNTVFNTCMYPSISVGDGHSIPVTNTGHSILPTPTKSLHLNNVLITPHIVKNLIYVRQFIRDNNCTIEFDAFGFSVKDFLTRWVLLRCDSTGDLYPVTAPSPIPHAFLVSQHTWHQRLGHPRGEVLRRLVSSNFISYNKEKPPVLCHACQLGKHVRLPFVSSSTVISSCFDIIHSDVWTSPIPSLSGFKYYVLFLDHYSQFVWVYPLVNKSDVMSKFVLFRNYVRTQFKCEIKSFQCDHGGEFDNRRLHTLFAQNGIQFRFSCPQTSQQNGKSERMVRTINNLIRTLLFQANLPPTFWVEALNMATQLLNILPSTAIANDIPYTRLYGKDPNYTLLRIFGVDMDETFSMVAKLGTIQTVLSLAASRHGRFISLMSRMLFFMEIFLRLSLCISLRDFETLLILIMSGIVTAYLLLYVDDIVLTTSSKGLLQRIIGSLHQEFAMTYLGPLNYFLGISVTHDSLGLFLSQKKYVIEILEKAHMVSCNPSRTPVDTVSKLGDDGDPISDPTLYQSLTGSLQYLTFTRQDISYAVQQVCLHMHDPREPHLFALKRILRYVQDWAGCPTTQRLTSGYLICEKSHILFESVTPRPVWGCDTARPQVPPISSNVSTAIVTASEKDPTTEVLTTARDTTPYTRRPRASREVVIRSTSPIPINIPSAGKEDKRKGKEIMTEPEKPAKAKIERDAEITRIHAEEDLRQMINELDMSNVMINKHMAEYEEAENDLTIEEKTELASKSERRKIYTSILRSHAGWKTKDFRGITFDQLEEKFILVWESIQDSVPMDSKKESESLKRSGILLERVKAKRLKTSDVSAQEQQESDNQDEIINLQQWAVLVREETSVNSTPSVVKVPICDWKIYKDKLREVYQIFKVGQEPKVYPYFESMLKDFDRDDLVTLWKLVKDRFKTELPKSDLEKCLFWPLKVMFEPVATDLLWQFEALIKS